EPAETEAESAFPVLRPVAGALIAPGLREHRDNLPCEIDWCVERCVLHANGQGRSLAAGSDCQRGPAIARRTNDPDRIRPSDVRLITGEARLTSEVPLPAIGIVAKHNDLF